MTEPESKLFSDPIWAIIELMGHNVLAGQVSEVEALGVTLARIDVPEADGRAAFTQFVGGTAIYRITPCDEQTAREALARMQVRPVNTWIVPDRIVPALSSGNQQFDETSPDWSEDWPPGDEREELGGPDEFPL